jgi:hypothetical protein
MRRANLLVAMACALVFWAWAGVCGAETTSLRTVQVDFGTIWCVPVYDGSHLVVSVEGGGHPLRAAKLDLDLNQVGEAVPVVSAQDLPSGHNLADHKQIFQDGYHYLAYSLDDGSGRGGRLCLLKLDQDLNRVGLVTVTEEYETNDMFLVGDGEYVYVGKFLPGVGHRVYRYDAELNLVGTYEIGGGALVHSNGAVAVWKEDRFFLVAPRTLEPGQNDAFLLLMFDRDWQPLTPEPLAVLEDAGNLCLVTSLVWHQSASQWLLHYARSGYHEGGPLYQAVFDRDWNLLSNQPLREGTWNHVHGVMVGDSLYLGYDGEGGVYLSSYLVSP